MTQKVTLYNKQFTSEQLAERLDTWYPDGIIRNFHMENCTVHLPFSGFKVFDILPKKFPSMGARLKEYWSAYWDHRPPKIFIQKFMNGRYYIDDETAIIQNCVFRGPTPSPIPLLPGMTDPNVL